MRVLVFYAHPVETSFVAALHTKIVEVLRACGHEVDDCDLNVEGFNPVMTRQERVDYHDTSINQLPVKDYIERLKRAEALVFVYPVWNFGFPAILKGVLDRVFLPGVSFDMRGGDFVPTLRHIKRMTAVATYGGNRWRAFTMGDPPKKCVTRMIRVLIAPFARSKYLACYDMNNTTLEKRAAFMKQVEAHFSGW
jgi:NAD(P)H dehydrogenase (quinone)